MALLNTAARMLLKPVPRFISPPRRAAVDFIMIGSFLASAAWFWRHNKRASVAALICGGAELAVCLVTNYPGGARKALSFGTRREIDLGLAAMIATMPEFLAFREAKEKNFFLAQGALLTAVREVTEFPDSAVERVLERVRAA